MLFRSEVRDGILNHTSRGNPVTLEGVVVSLSDRIAYINHDIDDACRAGILSNEDIPRELREILGETHSQRINTLVTDVIECSLGRDQILRRPEIAAAMETLRDFMFEHVYRNPVAKGEESKAREIIGILFRHYMDHPEDIPADFQPQLDLDGIQRTVIDYIAGMTDKYAVDKFQSIFIPAAWNVRS